MLTLDARGPQRFELCGLLLGECQRFPRSKCILHAPKGSLAVGNVLKAGLERLKKRHEAIGDVRGTGLFLGVELVTDRGTREPATELAKRVIEDMKDRGILLSTDGPLGNVLKIKPPLAFSELNADLLVKTLGEVLGEGR